MHLSAIKRTSSFTKNKKPIINLWFAMGYVCLSWPFSTSSETFPTPVGVLYSINDIWLYKIKNPHNSCYSGFRDPVRIQTWNLLIRSQMLYSIELRTLWTGATVTFYDLSWNNRVTRDHLQYEITTLTQMKQVLQLELISKRVVIVTRQDDVVNELYVQQLTSSLDLLRQVNVCLRGL